MRRVRRKRNQGEEGYTLLWVLMLGVVMVTLVSAAMFASSYVMGTGVHGLQTETVGHLTSDTEIQNDLSNIEQIITDTATKEQSELTDADGVSKVTGDAAQQLDAQGYTATITDSYTDSSGTIHEVVRVSKGGSSITLDVTFQSSGSGSTTSTVPVRQTQNPYPYSQYSSEYVADGNATTQAQVDAAEETKAGGPYIVIHSSTPGGNPTDLNLNSGTMTYGDAAGDMKELVTGNVVANSGATLTVHGSLDATNVTLNSGGTATIDGDVIANTVTVNGKLTISGQLSCQTLNINSGSQLQVGSLADGTALSVNTGFTIEQNASIQGGVTVNSNGNLTIDGSLIETGPVTVNSGATLHVKGDAVVASTMVNGTSKKDGWVLMNSQSSLLIDGNLCVDQYLYQNSGTTVKVQKEAAIALGTRGNGGSFSANPYVQSASCPVSSQPGGSGYTLKSITEI